MSIATISKAGRFSVFTGADRVLVPLSPAGLTLDVAGRTRHLAQHEAISFRGEEAVAAIDVASPGDDLNLMTRRGECGGSLELHRIDGAESFSATVDQTLLLLVVDGEVSWDDGPLLTRDAVLLPSETEARLTGRGRVAVVTVSRA